MGALSIRSNHCVVLVSSFWFLLLRMCWHEDSGEIVCYIKGPLLLLCGWPAEVRGSILPLVVIPLCCQASCALVWMSQHIALVHLLDCMYFLVIMWGSPTLSFLVLYVNIAYVCKLVSEDWCGNLFLQALCLFASQLVDVRAWPRTSDESTSLKGTKIMHMA
jgi:hypothetical protein